MSDFIYTSINQSIGRLSKLLCSIHEEEKNVTEFHGDWGSLAVIKNHYYGYEWIEDQRFIFIVISGPQVKKVDKSLVPKTETTYSEYILDKWKSQKGIEWSNDISGPFAIFCVNKIEKKIEMVTDLMSFIPIYSCLSHSSIIFGTHPDVVAKISNEDMELNQVSVVDLFVNKTVTFPYTLYKNVYQLNPSSVYVYNIGKNKLSNNHYWLPYEKNRFKNIEDASQKLREDLLRNVRSLTLHKKTIGVLMSGGEDSRVILSTIPSQKQIKCYTFVDYENVESKIAKKVSNIFKAQHFIGYRSLSHYLEQFESCSKLVGTEHNFEHVHSFGFYKKLGIRDNEIILGGLFADAFLKGRRISSLKEFKLLKVKYKYSEILKDNNANLITYQDPNVNSDLLIKVKKRRDEHFNRISSFRENSAAEWCKLWPASMNHNFTNYFGNRRLFVSYEPMLESDIVKLMSSVPQEWKVDRRLFHASMKPLLKNTKYISHSNGHYPYFGLKVNYLPTLITKIKRKFLQSLRPDRNNDGPWPLWGKVVKTELMNSIVDNYKKEYKCLEAALGHSTLKDIINQEYIEPAQKLIVIQMLANISYWSNNNMK
ncbi:hypothetical protein IUJ58_06235 [Priestia aryabhattai]|uniref:asparagine synthase-related protein n=1 Tax=Priestia aryabhattai TaxID=412384 RepID=UPI002379196C|nr:asparagine synthase-related protein [Priestia aryabhattai]WDL88474.1 hypothetical protein IUJ58_06235 [Priestia aryabhattai]